MEERNIQPLEEDLNPTEVKELLGKETREMFEAELEAMGGGASCKCHANSGCLKRT
ncbi:MAG: hypothetical protein LIP08_11145 [Bacteroides sp.]|nr:hypothetical protein [Bacteroides sp.]